MNRKISQDIAWNSASILIRLIIFVVSVPIIVGCMGEVHYGIFTLSQSLIGPLGFLSLSTKPASIKFMSEEIGKNDKEGLGNILQNVIGINLLVGMLVTTLLFILAPYIVRILSGLDFNDSLIAVQCFRVISVTWFLNLLSEPFISLLEANNDFRKVSLLNSFDWFFGILFGIFGLLLGGNVVCFLSMGCFIKLPLLIISIISSKSLFNNKSILPKLSWNMSQKLFFYGAHVSLYGLGSMIFENGSRYLIGIFLSVADAGMFSIILSVYQRIHELLGSVGRVLFPSFSKFVGQNDRVALENLYFKSSWLLSVLSFVIYTQIAIFGKWIFTIWLGNDAARAFSQVGIILSISFLFHSTGITRHSFMMGICAMKNLVINGWVAAISGLILSYIGLRLYGVSGSAWGFLSIILSGTLTWFLLQRKSIYYYGYFHSYCITFSAPLFGTLFILFFNFSGLLNFSASNATLTIIPNVLCLLLLLLLFDNFPLVPFKGLVAGILSVENYKNNIRRHQ